MSNYKVKVNEDVLFESDDYLIAYSNFLQTIEKIIKDNFGFFGMLGLPYSYEAYLRVDEDVVNNINLRNKADNILNLFMQIESKNLSLCRSVNENIELNNGEWNLTLNKKSNEIKIKSFDDKYYLKTNIFQNNKEYKKLYFDFYLEKVISIINESNKLGSQLKKEIRLLNTENKLLLDY